MDKYILYKGGHMIRKIREKNLKHAIIFILSLVIALVMSLHFSELIYAEETAPVLANEESGEVYGDAADESSADAVSENESKEASEAVKEEVPANAESDVKASGSEAEAYASGSTNTVETAGEDAAEIAGSEDTAAVAGTSAETKKAEAVEQAADAVDKTGTAEQSDSKSEAADTEKTADAGQSDSKAEAADTEKAAAAEQTDSKTETAATEKASDAEATDSKAEAADTEKTADAEKAGSSSGAAAAADANAAGDKNTEEEGSTAGDPMVKAGESVDALIYLLEVLKYHGNETDPAAFSLRAYTEDGQSVVTPVKDQSPWQTCWGFSAIAASESSILSECYNKWDQLAPGLLERYGIKSFKELCEWLDLSERQVAWFAFTPEPANGNYPEQAGEGLIPTEYGMGGIYNALGGNYYATQVFARGTGPLLESTVPYQNNEGAVSTGVKVTSRDGKEYVDQIYLDYMIEPRDITYECLIPSGMTKEDVIALYKDDPEYQETVRQRLERGTYTEPGTIYKYVDENGKYYHVARMNLLDGLKGYPGILEFVDADGNVYRFDPEQGTFPGLPLIRRAYYDWSVDDSLHYASVISLENSNMLPTYVVGGSVDEDAIKAIKEELLAGRGVSIIFCADTASPGSTNPAQYINTANNIWAHYTWSDTASANHGVTIVGYNDNFPKNLFLEGHEPAKDGAWLVKNSWGGGLSTGTNFASWGIDENGDGIGDGYFWLSYWDKIIFNSESFDYRVEDFVTNRMEYDIRQYDLMTTTEPLKYNSDKAANVFTAEMTTNVREIGVQHSHDDTTISYEIYLLNDDAKDPTDGILLASGEEYFKYSGYHRMKTNKVCIIPEGMKYSVVVTQMRAGKPYVSVFYDFNEQSVKDKEARGVTGIKKYSNAVVNKGESYILDEGKWLDLVDYLPELIRNYTSVHTAVQDNWMAVDNFSIKAYADYITQDLSAEATKIGSWDPATTVGVVDEEAAEKDALVSLALVHNEISNNATADKASAVEKGYITPEDYEYIVSQLIDQDRSTGLKVIVSTAEITAADMEEPDRARLQKAAKNKIALYADITLDVVATDTGEYMGSLHKTDDPISLAITIPADLLASGNPVYVLRLHNGVVERLATTVRDGNAYFESDVFSKYALAYEEKEPAEKPDPTAPEVKPSVKPAKPGSENVEPVVNRGTGRKQTTGIELNVVKPAQTGDVSNVNLWLALAGLSVLAVLAAVFAKRQRRS